MLKVEDVISKVNNMHGLLEVFPSLSSYEKLILHCCGLEKVYLVLFILRLWASLGLKNLIHEKEIREEKNLEGK